METYLGIDIGGTLIKYGEYSKDGEELSSGEVKTDITSLNAIINLIVDIINKHKQVSGIGVSMPGFVDVNSGQIIDAGSIHPLHNKNLKEIIYQRCEREIDIENDANCVALAEKWIGNGIDYSDFLAITIGTGIGGGIIIDNKLYRGHKFMSGEFGYMIVNGLQKIKPYYDTSNQIASTKALVNKVAIKKRIRSKDLNGKIIFEMIENNDKEVIKIYEQWIEYVSLTLYNLVFCFNPQAILIGGGVSANQKVIEDIKVKLNYFNNRCSDVVEVKSCKFNNNSGKIGAVYSHLVNNDKILAK